MDVCIWEGGIRCNIIEKKKNDGLEPGDDEFFVAFRELGFELTVGKGVFPG